jgi:hypothetical protein
MGAAAAQCETVLREEETTALRACACERCSGVVAARVGMVVPVQER